MIRYVLDTDVISLLMRENEAARAFVLSLPQSEIGVSIVTYEEQITGRLAQLRQARTSDQTVAAYAWLLKTAERLAPLQWIGFSAAEMSRFEALRAAKLNIGSNDLRIAATALEIGAAVVTRNRRDFSRVPDLALAAWNVTP